MATSHVNLLQEKCQKYKKDLPTYIDVDSDSNVQKTIYKCVCKLYSWVTNGSGTSKKMARQNAAKFMLNHVEEDSSFQTLKKNSSTDHVATKINHYALVNKKNMPLFLDKQNKVGSFVVECTFDGYTALGEGSNKKTAKENALEKIASHFNIHVFYDEQLKKKEVKDTKEVLEKVVKRLPVVKNPLNQLLELCQAKKLSTSFRDETVTDIGHGKTLHFVVSCSVNNLTTHSVPSFSKKLAKIEAAQLMLEKLKETTYFDTPNQSPSQSVQSPSQSVKFLSQSDQSTSQSVQSTSKSVQSSPRTIKRKLNSQSVTSIPTKKAKKKPARAVLNTLKKTTPPIKSDKSLFESRKRNVDLDDLPSPGVNEDEDDYEEKEEDYEVQDDYDDLPSSGVNEEEDDYEDYDVASPDAYEHSGDDQDDLPLSEADHSSDDGTYDSLPEADLSDDTPFAVRRN